MGYNADILAFGLKDRTLFNVQLKKGVHFAGASFFCATPANALQFGTKLLALGIFAIIGPILRVHSGKHTRRQHGRRVPRTFFVCPVRRDDRMSCLDTKIVQRADDLEPAQHSKDTVILSAVGCVSRCEPT